MKGVRNQRYRWDDFTSFYNYSSAKGSSGLVLPGSTVLLFELKKKPSLYRTFVVVYVREELAGEVLVATQQLLKMKEYTNRDEWGLKRYRFK